jgi:Cys-tRNA(Pro)/Cys-tRNA(Cys) deacylase
MGKKEAKTNAIRILETMKIPYEARTYECDDFVDAAQIADKLGLDHAGMYKTITTVGKSGGYYVFVVPIDDEIDFKKAAKAVGEKSIAMLKSKELLGLTGYIHGGCSPIGMKKLFKTTIHKTAPDFDTILFSGGKIGFQVEIPFEDFKKVINVNTADIIVEAV